jgi:enoyl-CoA hydratase
MTNKFKNILYDENDGIGILTLNRESALNALNEEVFVEMREFLEEICKKQLKGLILTGAGDKAFIAGADIKAMQDLSEQEAEDFSYFGQQVTFMLEEIRFPVIAAVNGFALGGGCEMALACDFILSTKSAKFGLPEVSLGLIPGFGGTQRLAKIVGRNRAKELVYTGRMINSDEAKDIGLVLEVYEDKTLLIEAAKNLLLKMAKNSPHAIGVAKFVINRGVDVSLEEGLKIERSHFGEIFGSKDMQEGTKAFIEKRKPVFTGE